MLKRVMSFSTILYSLREETSHFFSFSTIFYSLREETSHFFLCEKRLSSNVTCLEPETEICYFCQFMTAFWRTLIYIY